MSSTSTENRTARSGGRKLIYASLLVLLTAGIAVYFRLNPKFTALASATASKPEDVRSVSVAMGNVAATIRLTGSISAERFQMIQAPQLLGSRGPGHTVGNVSTSTTPSSTPSFTPANSSSFRGAGNRFSDRGSGNTAPTTPYTPPSTAGSLYNSLVTTQSLRGSGDSDFNLTLIKLANAGSRVKQGDVIAEFDRQTQLLRLDDYQDTVTQLNANIEKMRSDLQTTRKAHDHVIFAARAAFEKAELDLKTAPVRSANQIEKLKLNVEEARARYEQLLKEVKLLEESQVSQIRAAQIDRDQGQMELERAQRNVNLMVVRAPMDGIVVLQSIFRGGDMGPVQQGDQLYSGRVFMQVIDPASMLLNATANQVDAERIRIGMKAKVHLDAYPGREYGARVVGINALSKTSRYRPDFRGEIGVRLKLETIDENVIPDISGSADVILSEEDNVVIAPLACIFSGVSPGTQSVYVRTSTGWERRDVELGLRNNTHVAIRSGVASGDVLALSQPAVINPGKS